MAGKQRDSEALKREYAHQLDALTSEYVNLFIKERVNKLQNLESFLYGIIVAIATDYIITYLLVANLPGELLDEIKIAIFFISIIVLIYVSHVLFRDFGKVHAEIKLFNKLKQRDHYKMIKELGKQYSDKELFEKVLPCEITHLKNEIRKNR